MTMGFWDLKCEYMDNINYELQFLNPYQSSENLSGSHMWYSMMSEAIFFQLFVYLSTHDSSFKFLKCSMSFQC